MSDTKRIRYTGIGGSSIENNHGVWNVEAPETQEIDGEEVPHPMSAVKDVVVKDADVLLTMPHFEEVE